MDAKEIIVRCLHCGTKNRIPRDHLQSKPSCGRCGAYLDEIIIACLACGVKNRIPESRIHERPKCGKCGVPLVIEGKAAKPTEVTDLSFLREVIHSQQIAVVDCWANWCMPCRMMEPIFAELAVRYAGCAHFFKLNVEENPLTASQYDIRSIPTILIFRDGKLVDRLIGVQPKELIEERLLSIMKRI
ncbi:MAG TPA: thioredoxin [Syntrophales bacterium]|nr:thioredoxin [Syntrophales bacterium]HOL59372.1 thioredoxin [Syntrophales bacterium]HPO35529.1 thioredoxin [Syntrophales bacterium]